MLHPQRKTMDLVPLVCLCLLTWSAGTAADHKPVFVEEGSDVILPCSPSSQDNLVSGTFDWTKDDPKNKQVFFYDAGIHYNNGRSGQSEQFKGRVFHFEDQLKNGNASIKIRNTKVDDSGTYTCHFPHLQPSQTFYIELVVGGVLKDRSDENIPGAAPEPYIKTLNQTKDWALLQCKVHGDPLPKVEWKDRAGNILPAEEPQVTHTGGRYYVTLLTTVRKTDHYRCVATQEKFNHTISSETLVHLNGAASKPSVTILKTDDGMLLQCEVEGVSPQPKVEWKDSAGNILPAEEPQVSDRGGSYDVILQATVTKTDTFTCVVTQEGINHKISAKIYAQDSTGWIVPVVAAVFITLIVVGLIFTVLVCKGCIPLNCKKDEKKIDQTSEEPNSSTSLKESC